jgi:thiosulfate/3-mercaptopyruvate sulfurtransferase
MLEDEGPPFGENNMGCSKQRFIDGVYTRSSIAAGAVIFQLILAVLNLNMIISPVQAGTEDGSFCCTCPDYANFDAWLAKKAQICDNAGNIITPASKPSNGNGGKDAPAEKAIEYVEPQLIFSAGSKTDGMVIIDVRTPEEYAKGHLPGARNLNWMDTQSKGNLNPALMERALRKIGVNNSDHLLIYGGSDDMSSYIFWALSYLGHKNLTKMDGGIDQAINAGQPMVKSVSNLRESNYTSHVVPSLLVTENQLGKWLNRTDIQILDARDFSEYGLAKLTNAALPLDAPKLYQDNFKINDAKTLDDILGRRLDKTKTQLVYGTPAAYSLFYALELMGYNVTLLEGTGWKDTKWAISIVR